RGEGERLGDRILVYVHDGYGFSIRIGNVDLAKRRGVHTSVRLIGRRKALDDRHSPKIDNADLVLSPIGGVDLVQTGNVFQSGNTGHARYGFDQLVRLEIDDVEDARTKVRREEILI